MFWMPNGAKPAGMSRSVKPPSVLTWVKVLSNTSMVPAKKFVAKRKTPFTLTAVARPLYTAPLSELSTAMTARLLSGILSAQADRDPSSVSKMKVAGISVPGTRNDVVGFHTRPVGAAGVGGGGFVWVEAGWQAVLGTELSGKGIATWRAIFKPVPS